MLLLNSLSHYLITRRVSETMLICFGAFNRRTTINYISKGYTDITNSIDIPDSVSYEDMIATMCYINVIMLNPNRYQVKWIDKGLLIHQVDPSKFYIIDRNQSMLFKSTNKYMIKFKAATKALLTGNLRKFLRIYSSYTNRCYPVCIAEELSSTGYIYITKFTINTFIYKKHRFKVPIITKYDTHVPSSVYTLYHELFVIFKEINV